MALADKAAKLEDASEFARRLRQLPRGYAGMLILIILGAVLLSLVAVYGASPSRFIVQANTEIIRLIPTDGGEHHPPITWTLINPTVVNLDTQPTSTLYAGRNQVDFSPGTNLLIRRQGTDHLSIEIIPTNGVETAGRLTPHQTGNPGAISTVPARNLVSGDLIKVPLAGTVQAFPFRGQLTLGQIPSHHAAISPMLLGGSLSVETRDLALLSGDLRTEPLRTLLEGEEVFFGKAAGEAKMITAAGFFKGGKEGALMVQASYYGDYVTLNRFDVEQMTLRFSFYDKIISSKYVMALFALISGVANLLTYLSLLALRRTEQKNPVSGKDYQ